MPARHGASIDDEGALVCLVASADRDVDGSSVSGVSGGRWGTLWGWPGHVELPWSDLHDFVQAKNGDIYVDVAFYGRVARYTRDGRFVASYPTAGKSRHLAADVHGHLHWLSMNTVQTRTADWNLIQQPGWDSRLDRTWALDRNELPAHAPDHSATAIVSDKLVEPGQLLFHDRQSKRQMFTCPDGTVLRRRGASLVRLTPDGKVIERYAPPWYLWFVTFPWPAAVVGWGLPLVVLMRSMARGSGSGRSRAVRHRGMMSLGADVDRRGR